MTCEEIKDLMKATGWSASTLAYHLDMSEDAVWKWIREKRSVRGPAGILMRQWLTAARANGKKKEKVTA